MIYTIQCDSQFLTIRAIPIHCTTLKTKCMQRGIPYSLVLQQPSVVNIDWKYHTEALLLIKELETEHAATLKKTLKTTVPNALPVSLTVSGTQIQSTVTPSTTVPVIEATSSAQATKRARGEAQSNSSTSDEGSVQSTRSTASSTSFKKARTVSTLPDSALSPIEYNINARMLTIEGVKLAIYPIGNKPYIKTGDFLLLIGSKKGNASREATKLPDIRYVTELNNKKVTSNNHMTTVLGISAPNIASLASQGGKREELAKLFERNMATIIAFVATATAASSPVSTTPVKSTDTWPTIEENSNAIRLPLLAWKDATLSIYALGGKLYIKAMDLSPLLGISSAREAMQYGTYGCYATQLDNAAASPHGSRLAMIELNQVTIPILGRQSGAESVQVRNNRARLASQLKTFFSQFQASISSITANPEAATTTLPVVAAAAPPEIVHPYPWGLNAPPSALSSASSPSDEQQTAIPGSSATNHFGFFKSSTIQSSALLNKSPSLAPEEQDKTKANSATLS